MHKKDVDNDKLIYAPLFGTAADTVSNTEMTGLIPSIVHDEFEADSYGDIEDYNADKYEPDLRK